MAGTLLSSTALAEMLCVAADMVNFREGPSTKSAVLYTADKYFTVEVIERKDDWVKTRDFEGDIAWVAAHLLEKRSSVVVHVPSALIRESPDKEAPIVFKVDRGEGMVVHAKQRAWLQISSATGSKGWVHRDVVWGDAKQ